MAGKTTGRRETKSYGSIVISRDTIVLESVPSAMDFDCATTTSYQTPDAFNQSYYGLCYHILLHSTEMIYAWIPRDRSRYILSKERCAVHVLVGVIVI
jgi:hypothetical protein